MSIRPHTEGTRHDQKTDRQAINERSGRRSAYQHAVAPELGHQACGHAEGPPQASCSPGAPRPPATSSPMRMTRGSALHLLPERLVDRLTIGLLVMRVPSVCGRIDIGQQVGLGRRLCRLGQRDALLDALLAFAIDVVERLALQQAGLGDAAAEQLQRIFRRLVLATSSAAL